MRSAATDIGDRTGAATAERAAGLDRSSVACPLPPVALPLATEWMLPNGLRSSDLSSEQTPIFPDDIGRAYGAFHSVQPDSFIMDVESRFNVPVTLDARVLFNEPILALRLPTSGRAVVHNQSYGQTEESDERWNLALVADSACKIEHRPGETHRCLVAVFTVSRLQALLDNQRCPAPVERFLAGQADAFGAAAQTSSRLVRTVAEMRRNPYRGAMAALYAEGKLCELLAEAFTILGAQEERQGGVSGRDRKAAMAAYDLIREHLTSPLQIEDIARQVGLSQRRLAEAFRDLFGASPFQCLTQWRLDAARDLLEQGDLSVKQIAYSMGYAHVSSFTQAFVRQFGRPPRARSR